MERNITETVLTNETSAETAEVQVEAAARREQCGCVHYELPHKMSWRGKATTVHNHITRNTPMTRRATKSHDFILYRHDPSGSFGKTNDTCDSRFEIWAEKCRSGGNEHKVLVPGSFLAACVLKKKKKKTEEEEVEEKSLETFAATFNPHVCFAAKLKSTRRKNTQDQHAAGKLVFHVASSCDVQWHHRYVHSSDQPPTGPISTVHWRFLSGNKVHSFESVSWLKVTRHVAARSLTPI